MSVKDIDLPKEAKRDDIVTVLNELKETGKAFEIYDPYYPSPSDPGAYMGYLYQGSDAQSFDMTLGNHGWSGGIYQINEDLIVNQFLHIARTHNGLRIKIEKAQFFSHHAKESVSNNKKMNTMLAEIHP